MQNSVILPIAHERVKIFDLASKTTTLLLKMIPRGLTFGPKPLKVLFTYRLDSPYGFKREEAGEKTSTAFSRRVKFHCKYLLMTRYLDVVVTC